MNFITIVCIFMGVCSAWDQACVPGHCQHCIATPAGKYESLDDTACSQKCLVDGVANWPCDGATLCKCSTTEPVTLPPTTSTFLSTTPADEPCKPGQCSNCVATSAGKQQSLDDAACSQNCLVDGHTYWPCDGATLCKCSAAGSTTTIAPVTTAPVTTATVTTTVPVTTTPVTTTATTTTAPVTTAPATTAPADQKCDSNCSVCVATEEGIYYKLDDAACSTQCLDEAHTYWPCTDATLCKCAQVKTTTTPAPLTTMPPTHDHALNEAWEQIYAKLKDVDYSNTLFLSMKPDNKKQSCIGEAKKDCQPSKIYRGADFLAATEIMIKDGIAGKKLYIGDYKDSDGNLNASWGPEVALMNLALFLGQSMEETILYDACDENSWDRVHKVTGQPFDFQTGDWSDRNYLYPQTNACGQLGQAYADYTCDAAEKMYECPQDDTMEMEATTHSQWWGAPPALKCGPNLGKSTTWDFGGNQPHAVGCGVNGDEACPNGDGETDLTGCCWWGRGIIQTTGRCNIGKLNYFLGAGGPNTKYPEVNLCKKPNLICEGPSDLKWMAGFYYWIDKVQINADAIPSLNVPAFQFEKEIQEAVNAKNSDSMAAKCSGLVNRGCASGTKCKAGKVDKLSDRQHSTSNAVHEFLGGDWNRRLSTEPVIV